MNQKQNINLIKKIFKEHYKNCKIRFIKIHGSQYQESGLPDLMILVKPMVHYKKYWLEIKRDWKDTPTALQEFNIKDLRNFGYITGFISGNECKRNWTDKPQKLQDIL